MTPRWVSNGTLTGWCVSLAEVIGRINQDRKRARRSDEPFVLVGLIDVVATIVENGSEFDKFPLQSFPVGVVIKAQSSCLSPLIL